METLDFIIDGKGTVAVADFSDTAATRTFTVRLSFTRLRDANTGLERLLVKLYENGGAEPYAQTFIGNLQLERDITRLREYGIFLSLRSAKEIINQIKNGYTKLTVLPDISAKRIEDDLPDILRFICEYIVNEDIKAVAVGINELYNIKVVDFARLISNSKFACYSGRDIRSMLYEEGITTCTNGRLDNTVKIDGKAVKVVSLYADEISDIIQELSEAVTE